PDGRGGVSGDPGRAQSAAGPGEYRCRAAARVAAVGDGSRGAHLRTGHPALRAPALVMDDDASPLLVTPAREDDRDALAALLVETVAANGSVGFMHPLAMAEALAFWDGALQSAQRDERIVLCARRGGLL